MSKEERYKYICNKVEYIDGYILDDKTTSGFHLEWACNLLNKQDHEIQELKKKLENAIVPKFKINEDVYIIWHGMIIDVEIKAIGKNEYYVDTCHFDLADGYGGIFVDEDEIFKTHEEAEAKLKEMKSE